MIYYGGSYCVWFSGPAAIRAIKSQRVFRMACTISCVAGVIAFIVKSIDNHFQQLYNFMPETFVYGTFAGVLGFLLVFRTGQAYTRFDEGASLTRAMTANFLDATSLLLSLTRASKGEATAIYEFHRVVVRLVSCLNAVCLADLEQKDLREVDDWTDGILDVAGLDTITVDAIQKAVCKAECVSQRIQSLITDGLDGVLLGVPAPLLTRVYQEFGSGMIRYHEALKLIHVPFPFPFVAVTECLLYWQTFFTPLMVSVLTTGPFSTGAFTFAFLFFVWTLYGLSTELDNPFGTDVNDLDLAALQDHVNLRLVSALMHTKLPPAGLSANPADEAAEFEVVKRSVIEGRKTQCLSRSSPVFVRQLSLAGGLSLEGAPSQEDMASIGPAGNSPRRGPNTSSRSDVAAAESGRQSLGSLPSSLDPDQAAASSVARLSAGAEPVRRICIYDPPSELPADLRTESEVRLELPEPPDTQVILDGVASGDPTCCLEISHQVASRHEPTKQIYGGPRSNGLNFKDHRDCQLGIVNGVPGLEWHS